MKRTALVALLLTFALPVVADIGHEVTLPIAGVVYLPNVTYRTELVLRNHRDVPQQVVIEFIGPGQIHGNFFPYDGLAGLGARETVFYSQGFIPNPQSNFIVSMRIWAGKPTGEVNAHGQPLFAPDPEGRIEAIAHIVGDRGRFAHLGSSRQEINGTSSTEYFAREAVFHGIRHDGPAYTNVGITNLDPTRTVTFYVEFRHQAPLEVVVAPLSLISVRVPGEGNNSRSVKVYPAWAMNDGEPTPWVAYASSVDTQTGDAWTGVRSLATVSAQD